MWHCSNVPYQPAQIRNQLVHSSFVTLFGSRYSSTVFQLWRKLKIKIRAVFVIQDNWQLRFIQEWRMRREGAMKRGVVQRKTSFLLLNTVQHLFSPPYNTQHPPRNKTLSSCTYISSSSHYPLYLKACVRSPSRWDFQSNKGLTTLCFSTSCCTEDLAWI